MATLRRNGKAYDSADVNCQFLGAIPDEVFDIAYDVEGEHQANYSIGSHDPTSWSRGKNQYQGSITLAASDQFKIEDAARNAGLQSVIDIPPFPVIITFLNEFNQVRVDRLTAKFMNDGRNVDGNMSLRYQYKLFVLGFQLNQPV